MKKTRHTIGLDLGDRQHVFCVLDAKGQIVSEGKVINSHASLGRWAKDYRGATVVMEAGTHSPWVSRLLSESGLKVLVANPRKLAAIFRNERKSDRRDAEILARLGRSDPKLLYPIVHGSAQAQQDMLEIKLRDALVRSRVALINSVRFTLKSLGYRVTNPSSATFHKVVLDQIPTDLHSLIAPVIGTLQALTEQIHQLERSAAKLAAERYPEATRLQQISGVGPITALYFVLKIEDPSRFANIRDVGPFLGLCPGRDQSGEVDKQLRISKRGDSYLRRLLISSANYILGPFGPDCQLRRYGIHLVTESTARARKRAVVAVARKLAVLMLSLWKNQTNYHPLPEPAH